jgi:M6 family metalloprotease-like protein
MMLSRLIRIGVSSCAVLFPLAAMAVEAGRLELKWGDPQPGTSKTARFRADLRLDDGSSISLDTQRLQPEKGSLHALFGQRVWMEPSADSRLSIAAISVLPTTSSSETISGVIGNTVWASLLCKFADIPDEPKAREFFAGQYGENPGQLGHYWREVSYGKINLEGSSAHGWYTLPHPRSHYLSADETELEFGLLFEDCTAAADADVDFSANGGLQGINMMFNADLDGAAWGGGHCGELDGIDKCWSATWNPPWSFENLAPLGHEMGHGYGLPHANNSDEDSNPYDNPWDVLSDAWNHAEVDPTYGIKAKHLSIYSRYALGFIDDERKLEISDDGVYNNLTLDRASLLGSNQLQMIKISAPGATNGRYFTVEARKRSGTYEGNLAGDAVIVHEVVPGRSEPAWSMDASVPPADHADNEGSMFKVGESWIAAGGAVRVDVLSATEEGFVVRVTRTSDRIFGHGFE